MQKIEVPEFIKGLIFDCDGTLVDSMPFHMNAWEHAIRFMGQAWHSDFFVSRKGMPEENIVVCKEICRYPANGRGFRWRS
jgi:beta-phosphoglucomutase-like phosphatase (HAD superfamily)